MTKTLKIEGMSCMHCVSAVKKALEEIEGVSSVAVDLAGKCAVVELSGPNVTDDNLRAAIEEEGFEVISIACQ